MTRSRIRAFLCAMVVVMVPVPAVLAPPSALVVACSATLAMAAALSRWPYRGITLARAASLVTVVSFAVALVYQGRHQFVGLWLPVEMCALLLLLGRVVRRLPGWQAAVIGTSLGIAITVELPLRLTLRMPNPTAETSILVCFMSFFPVAVVAGIALYLRSLDDRRVRAVARARRAQRLDVARDLHDFVAHEVTGIVLEAQAAQLADQDPEGARALAVRVEEAGLRALASMDHMVGALRDPDERAAAEPPPTRMYGLADLPDLVGRFSATGGIPAELQRAEEPADDRSGAPDSDPNGERPEKPAGTLPREIESTAYAVVLEALTNVRRHAPSATRVLVSTVRTAGPALEVSVVDDGGDRRDRPQALTGKDRPGGGTGLIGLAERVEALGGTLTTGRHGKGWQVRAVLPVPNAQTGTTVGPDSPSRAVTP
ncbi:sensor histidine kinase [Streptosporangium amethystogenes]|uniref:sensor histidine kinase n=1 Tax=Streptosporangium amethystogenes TaxID=2002 RepID=UPI00068A50C0|nr:histidine kinase [Streptosporangium amethystogenes]